MKNIYNYRTLSIGTKSDCLNSEYAYVLDLDFEPTLSNLDKLKETIKNNCNLVLNRISSTSDISIFENEKDITSVIKFNTIVFGNSDLSVIGFIIRFLKIQETSTISRNIIKKLIAKVKINVDKNIDDESLISFELSTKDVIDSPQNRIGTLDYQYKPKELIINKENYQKYTSRINQLMENEEMAMIMGECGVSNKNESWRFWVKEKESIEGFNEISVCFYEDDLCCLKFDTKECYYEITSLTKDGHFGTYSYKSGQISPPENSTFYKLVGPNIIYTTDNSYHIYPISNLNNFIKVGYQVEKEQSNIPYKLINNPWNISGYLEFSTITDIFNKFNSILQLDLKEERDEVIETTGGGIKINYGIKSEECYISNSGYLINNTDLLYWITYNLAIISDDDSNIYLVPKLYDKTRIFYDSKQNIIIRDEEDYNNTYVISKININNSYKSLDPKYRIILDGLRRKPFRITFPSPSNMITFRGLIFYKNNNYLYLY